MEDIDYRGSRGLDKRLMVTTQGAHSSEGRTPVPYREEHLQVQKNALQGAQEKRCAVECTVRLEQFVHGQGEAVPIVGKTRGKLLQIAPE